MPRLFGNFLSPMHLGCQMRKAWLLIDLSFAVCHELISMLGHILIMKHI